MYLDLIIRAFKRIVILEEEIADLKQRLSRKPKHITTQVQLFLEFDIAAGRNEEETK